MSTILNTLSCLVTRNNTGFTKCKAKFGAIAGFMAVPRDWTASETDLADADTAKALFEALIVNDSPALRGYPFFGLDGKTTVGGKAASKEDLGLGGEVTTDVGHPSWTFRAIQGDECTYQTLLSFNGKQGQYAFLLFDVNGLVKCAQKLDANGNTVACGLRATDIYVATQEPAGIDTSPKNMITIQWEDAAQLREQSAYIQLDFNCAEVLTGLNDVTFVITPVSAHVWDFNINYGCSNEDMAAYYDSEIDDTIFIFTNRTTGNVIDITSVVYTAPTPTTRGKWRVTLDNTDTDYPGSGGYIVADFVGVSDLITAGIIGVEAVPKQFLRS